MSGLSTVQKSIANDELSEWSITSTKVASAASSRPDGVTSDTGGTVKIASVCSAFLEELLLPVLLNHVYNEAVVCSRWDIGEVEVGRAHGKEGVRVQDENVLVDLRCNVRHGARGMSCFWKCTLLHLELDPRAMRVHGM